MIRRREYTDIASSKSEGGLATKQESSKSSLEYDTRT